MPSPEETRAMQEIMDKLNNATKARPVVNTQPGSSEPVRGNVSPDAQEMYNILHKLQNATENSAKSFVKESAGPDPIIIQDQTQPSFGVGGLNVVLNKTSIHGYKKTYYSITEDGQPIVEELALFESAMAIVKNKLGNEDTRKTDRIIDLDTQYASYLEEAAAHKQRARKITESVRYDVAMAKHQVAADRMKQLKAQIKKLI